MLRKIVESCLRYRGFVIALALLVVVYGLYVTATSEFDVFPDFVPPQAEIQTEAPGFSPEQVEMLVTRPLENALNGITSQAALRSVSIQGLSIISVIFKQGTDVFTARQLLSERLATAFEGLPAGVKQPRMPALTSSTMDLLKIGLTSDVLTPMELRSFAEWELKPRLLSVPGVADISIFGGEVRQIQVHVDPVRLASHGLSIQEIFNAVRSAIGVRGTGFIDTPSQRLVIQTEGHPWSADALGKILVAQRGTTSIRLGDVAKVSVGAEPRVGDCLIQGRKGVLLALLSQYGSNTIEVTRHVESALKEIEPLLAGKGITLYPRLHRPATFTETALRNIRWSLFIGACLVAVVLFGFLGSTRTALISLTAIPLSLLSAVILLSHLGVTLNTITIGGLAIAIGEVVDDAIIDVENIFRRLREGRATDLSSRAVIVRDASVEVRSAVVYATLIVIVVFIPILFLSGLQGSFFSPLALSYILAVSASLIVALTVTPALAFLLFGKDERRRNEPPFLVWLKRRYRRGLRRICRRPGIVAGVAALVTLLAAAGMFTLGGEFLPSFREGHFVLQIIGPPGTSLDEMLRIGKRVSDRLLDSGFVETMELQVGRAELGVDAWPPNRSEAHVELKPMPGAKQLEAERYIRNVLRSIPGIQYEVTTFLGDRIGESITGETADVVVNVFGDDLEALDGEATRIAAVLRSIRGATDMQLKAPSGTPRIVVKLRPDRLSLFGFRSADLLDTVEAAYQGTVVGQIYQGVQITNVAVRVDGGSTSGAHAVARLPVRSPAGTLLPLAQIADVYETTGRNSIRHEGARRRRTVTCNVRGRDLADFVKEAKQQVRSQIAASHGMYVTFAGAAQARATAERELAVDAAIAAVGVLLLLMLLFGSWRRVLLIVMNLPFALVGGVLSLYVTRLLGGGEAGTITMGSLVGFVTLFGITTRNSIMMLTHFEHLVSQENAPWGIDTAIRGAAERLVPILMTALVTGLGLLPLALGSSEAGREIEGPMAIVILGGLVTSTALNLLVLPTLSLQFGDFGKKKNERSLFNDAVS